MEYSARATASLVLGILGVVLLFILWSAFPVLPLILGIIGLVLAVNESRLVRNTLLTWAYILSLIAVVGAGIFVIAWLACIGLACGAAGSALGWLFW